MEFHSSSHIYKCIPPVLGISTEWEKYKAKLEDWKNDTSVLTKEERKLSKPKTFKPVIFHLKCLSMPELDESVYREAKARSERAPEEAQRIIQGFTQEKIAEKVVKIENLIIDGEEVTDFNRFYEIGPPELVSWVCKAVYSTHVLSRAEIKN